MSQKKSGGSKSSKERTFDDFIRTYQIKSGGDKDTSTNTRIPNPEHRTNKYGGNYAIPSEEYTEFLGAYYNGVLYPGKTEHMTEKQLRTDGPILLDFDLHYPDNQTERLYTETHIDNLVAYLVERLERLYQLRDDETKFNVYVMEKPACQYSAKHKVHKDGLHIIIGIRSDLETQILLRKQMLATNELADIFADIPLANPWTGILDEGVAKGDVKDRKSVV